MRFNNGQNKYKLKTTKSIENAFGSTLVIVGSIKKGKNRVLELIIQRNDIDHSTE